MTVSNLALIPARETAVTEPNIHQMGDTQTKRAPTKSRSMPSLIRYRASLDFPCDRAEEAGLDVLTGLREMMPVIGHVQIALVPLRNEPGTGELDDFRVLQELESLGYTGFVGCAANTVRLAIRSRGSVG